MTVLPYKSTRLHPALKRAGIVMIVWASIQLPLGIAITGYGAIILGIGLLDQLNHSVIGVGLFFSTAGTTLLIWSINTLRHGLALLIAKPVTLGWHILLTLLSEIIAYLFIVVYLWLIYDALRRPSLFAWILCFPLYMLLPLSLTFTRRTLLAAEKHMHAMKGGLS